MTDLDLEEKLEEVREDLAQMEKDLAVLRQSLLEDDAAVREAWRKKALLYGVG
jgi:hypothetical protein